MSELIHMSPEEVSGLLAEIESLLRRWDDDLSLLHTLGSAIHQIWEAPAAVDYIYEVHRILHAMEGEVERLQYNHRLARHEFEEWLAADALLGDGAGVSVGAVVGGAGASEGSSPPWVEHICKGRKDEETCKTIWSKPPQSAYDLAYMIDSLPEDQPIGIFPLSNGEVLVLLKGTDPVSPARGNNWGSAIESFFTHNSSYQLSVLAALKAAQAQGLIPEGAKLRIAGHSQGGMVAENLSSDPRLRKMGLEVETVVTFGSPDTYIKVNPGTKYIMFEHASDRVAQIDEVMEGGVHAYTALGLSADTVKNTIRHQLGLDFNVNLDAHLDNLVRSRRAHQLLNDVERVAERHVLPVRGFNPLRHVFDHSYVHDQAEAMLNGYQLPFTDQHLFWGQEGLFYESTIQTPGAFIYFLEAEPIKLGLTGKW